MTTVRCSRTPDDNSRVVSGGRLRLAQPGRVGGERTFVTLASSS